MYTLFISTYNSKVIISILKDGIKLLTKEKESKNGHSLVLVPTIEEIINDIKIDIHDLNEIIVVNGPGSFTGVRLGITVAKTLAYTLNIPIKTITSIESISCSINQNNKIIYINDNKGKYIGKFIDNKLEELIYLKEDDALNYINNHNLNTYTDNLPLDIEKIYEYVKDINVVPAHAVKALYVKDIEVQSGK